MNEIEFIYEGRFTSIQCQLKDKMKDIFTKFSTKTQLDINNIYFLSNGVTINSVSLLDQIKQDDNKITILVNDINPTNELFLNINLNNYHITLIFTQNFDIRAEYGKSLNKKLYNGSFSFEELKN